MLLFIYKNRIFQNQWNHVSIHHMLLFIKCTVEPPLFVSTFQYITCYSLSQAPNPFYHLQSWFQYITCYSLSVIGLVTVHTCERFNTSHVTLYQIPGYPILLLSPFQYITCYSLSADRAEIKRYKIMFQYITCYSLSTVDSNLCAVSSRFNTSHVTLYLWQQKQVHLWNSFNTSHVTLYHWPIFPGTHYSLVSIHHMLLFIYEHIVGGGENDVVSIHHMLLFINMELSNLRPAEVSIHHMLLFI